MTTPATLAPWPQFDAHQIDAATRVLASGKVNPCTGQETSSFEREFAAWCGTAIANGSLALSAAYLAIGLGPGHAFITAGEGGMVGTQRVHLQRPWQNP